MLSARIDNFANFANDGNRWVELPMYTQFFSIVSGGGIEFMRFWTEKIYGIPPERVIGSSIKMRRSICKTERQCWFAYPRNH